MIRSRRHAVQGDSTVNRLRAELLRRKNPYGEIPVNKQFENSAVKNNEISTSKMASIEPMKDDAINDVYDAINKSSGFDNDLDMEMALRKQYKSLLMIKVLNCQMTVMVYTLKMKIHMEM